MAGINGVGSITAHQPWADRLRQAISPSREASRSAAQSDPAPRDQTGPAGTKDRVTATGRPATEGRAGRATREAANPTGEGLKLLQGQHEQFKKALDGIASLQKTYAESLISAARQRAANEAAQADDTAASPAPTPAVEVVSPALPAVQALSESRATPAVESGVTTASTRSSSTSGAGAGGSSTATSPAATGTTAPTSTATAPAGAAAPGQTGTTAPASSPEATSTGGTSTTAAPSTTSSSTGASSSTEASATTTASSGTSTTSSSSPARGQGKHVDKRV